MASEFPETLLLLKATEPEARRNIGETEKILDEKINWSRLLDIAFSLKLVSLLNAGIAPFYESGKIPEEITNTIKNRVRFTAGMNLGYFNELKKVTSGLRRAGVRSCLLKGASLILSVYKSVSMRSFGDIDILIMQEDLDKAIDVFGSEYRVDYFLPSLELCKKKHFHVSLVRNIPPHYCFELHWSVYTPDSGIELPASILWKDTVQFVFDNYTFHTLSHENTLLHLIIHLTRNAFSSPRDLWDMHWMFNKCEINLDILNMRIEEFELGNRAAACMLFLDELFKTNYLQKTCVERHGRKLEQRKPLKGNINLAFLLGRGKKPKDDVCANIAFLFQKGLKGRLLFMGHLLFPGIYWLTIYSDDLTHFTIKTRLRIAFRGTRLLAYLLYHMC